MDKEAPERLDDDSLQTTKSFFDDGILAANRGEIAVRIITTLKKLDIRSIAIYSPQDHNSLHVKTADVAYSLPGNTLATTYLSSEAIIRIAKESRPKAIIPGYGFLSESAEFAAACEADGLIWIGPTPEQMRSLGLKHLARELAQECGVPILPGTNLITDIETAVVEAEEIGYPVILKSSAGGGGIGLQQCANSQQLRDTFDSTRHLAQSFFHDDRIFIEKYVERAKHVEVQILGNGEGVVTHACERDCSLQRRKQKVIEEAPAVLIPVDIRKKMREAACKLAARVSYRGVGTVEFLYDLRRKTFFFLEVNTRLQVEHTATEEVTGLDFVEVMLRIAANDSANLFSGDMSEGYPTKEVAIEARIYGESPLQGFKPSPGQLLDVSFPAGVRVDTWVESGSILSSEYDSLLAKLIVSGHNRGEAVRRLTAALDATKISGIETNLGYLKEIVRSTEFQTGMYTTTFLDNFQFHLPAFEVLEPGPSTSVQDFPGRQGLWHIGIPPSGPMDDFAFRLANRILGNYLGAAALECTHAGPKLLFHHDTKVAVVGGSALLCVDDVDVPFCCSLSVKAGQTLQLGVLESGCRAYIAVRGGIDVPKVFGSGSTFALGKIGGHCGRLLEVGDILPFNKNTSTAQQQRNESFTSIIPHYSSSWVVKVIPGPHAFPDIFSKSSFTEFFTKPWEVHYNSNRVGVRLIGPKPEWARENGGMAGLHPSNIHDSPYSIGSISFTGDEAVILTCDGPSLGGFVIFATIIEAELWKVGQMKPGDQIFLTPVTASEALLLNTEICNSIIGAYPLVETPSKDVDELSDPILGDIGSHDMKILCRQSGDRAILLEFGDDDFNIRATFCIYGLISGHADKPIPGVIELSPGVRSLHILYDPKIYNQEEMVKILQTAILTLTSDLFDKGIPSRIFNLPLAHEHSTSLAAVERYSKTIREEAPWLPNNVEFLRRINGLTTKQEVNETLLSATYLVLGLGDVFCGSPCAIPLDPRHRLFGMKYNPSRSYTPEGTVGLGGQYLCIYGIDSPGGYQLVGRTVPIWNRWAKRGKPWMFNVFDQIRFYPISEEALNEARSSGQDDKLVTIEDSTFNLHDYERWLSANQDDIMAVTEKRWQTLRESDAVAQALKKPPPPRFTVPTNTNNQPDTFTNGVLLRAGVAGKCWKSAVRIGDVVQKGQTLFYIEAMKMEIKLGAPCNGTCIAVFVKSGDILAPESLLAEIDPI